MKNTLMHCSKRLLLYALVAAGLIQARAAEGGAPPTEEAIGQKCLSAITNLYPNARVISTRGALQIKTRTHDARVPVQFKVSNLPPAYQSVEVPLASDFVLSLRVRPGPYHEVRELGNSLHLSRNGVGTNEVSSTAALVEFPARNVYAVADISFGRNCDLSKLRKVYDVLMDELEQRFGEPWRGVPGEGLRPAEGAANGQATGPFFADCLQDVPNDANFLFRPFISPPAGEPSLPASQYLQVCQSFALWCRAVLKAQYVPSDSFIVSHIRLVSARAGRPYDTAFLACSTNGTQYLIVQTGGLNGRLFFVTRSMESMQPANEAGAEGAAVAALRTYLNLPRGLGSLTFDTKQRGARYCVEVLGHAPTSTLNELTVAAGAQYIICRHDSALSVRKEAGIVFGSAAAREPAADAWFQWEMSQGLRLPFPNESAK